MIKKIVYLIRKYNDSINTINNLDQLLEFKIKSNYLLATTGSSSELITQPKSEGETELIVSFTTYDKRIHDAHLVIESIAQQTIKPNRLILWLDEDEFTLETIPLILHKQIKRGLEIRFCPNYRSYKKLIPTLKLFPEANIITIDDDILYPDDMVEGLVREHSAHPNCIIGHRIHKITLDSDKKVVPYSKWTHEIESTQASMLNIAIGVGGVFYPKGSLNKECFNVDVFSKLAPNADDVWFKAMTTLNGFKAKKVDDGRYFWGRFIQIESGQDIALSVSNYIEHGNDSQIREVFDKYNIESLLD